MPSQKAPKAARDLTTDEAMERLFHPKVIEHAKRHAHSETIPKKRSPQPPDTTDPNSMQEH